jgi:hypothetical protein
MSTRLLVVLACALLFGLAPVSIARDEIALAAVPAKVLNALKAKFPKAKISKISKEKEDGRVIYDIEFTQDGKKFEADIFENGSYQNWEQEIALKDLPAGVVRAIADTYNKPIYKEVMAVMIVRGGKDVLRGYEIKLSLARGKEIELKITPDGKGIE